MGKRLLGASRSVPGVAVRGDLGWRKLEERREGKKLMHGKRLEGLEDNRLVKIVVEKLKDAGNVGWWGEYGALQRKYVITEEDQAKKGGDARKQTSTYRQSPIPTSLESAAHPLLPPYHIAHIYPLHRAHIPSCQQTSLLCLTSS